MISLLKEQAGVDSGIVSEVLDAVAEAIGEDEDLQIYTEGATNIFKYPELSDGQKASKLLSTLEQKELLKNLFTENDDGGKKNEIQVYIGDETPVESMKDCSVVTAAAASELLVPSVWIMIKSYRPSARLWASWKIHLKMKKGEFDSERRDER